MRPVLLFVVAGASCLAVGGGSFAQALAAEDSKDLPAATLAASLDTTRDAALSEVERAAQAGITRVAIAISGGLVVYTDQFRQNPPAIVIEFRSRNVIAGLEPVVAVQSGIVSDIRSDYYRGLFGRRALKSLTLGLVEPASYAITQQAGQIVIDIDTPQSLLPGRMSVGTGMTVLGIEANATILERLKVMGDALQRAVPQKIEVIAKPQPAVVTKPVEIPKPVFQPEPKGEPVSKGGRGGFWPGVLLGIGGTTLVVAGRRRRRKTAVAPGAPAEVVPMTQGASVYEQLILKAMQRQGQKLIGSKAIEGLGAIWIVEKEGARHGVLCLIDGEFFERKVLEQFLDALKQETLPSGTVMALGAFTAPAQAFAKECGIALVAREEVLRMINAELKGPVLEPEAAAYLARLEGELAQAQERVKALEQQQSTHAEYQQKVRAELEAWEREVDTLKERLQQSAESLSEERTKNQSLEQQIADLTQKLADKDQLLAQASQEADRLKATAAEVDQHLAAEREKKTALETQVTKLQEQLKMQAPAAERVANEQPIQEAAGVTAEAVKESVAEETKISAEGRQGQERRKWPRLDLATRKEKGILVRATSDDGEPSNGDARNVSAGGICLELPQGERLADEFELKLFLPDRTKPIEAIGKLIWKGRSRRRVEQLGVAFSAINAPDQEAISQFVEARKREPVSVG